MAPGDFPLATVDDHRPVSHPRMSHRRSMALDLRMRHVVPAKAF
jgi:hypothetical protein